MLREISSVFSFLTIIPTSNANLETIAKHMYLFPIVGIVIGIIVGGFGYGLWYIGLEPLVVGLFVMIAIALITGIHHTDGLADFADGLMAKGSKAKKLKAMKDVSTGTAGILSIVLYVVGLILALSLMDGYQLFTAILLSEILAKFAMVLQAALGNSAITGSNSPFVQIMKDKKRLFLASAITLIPVIVLGGTVGAIAFVAIITITIFIVAISTKSFGGITGDVLGATNELARLSSIIVFASI